ncbi:hypothetical protein C3369_07285 [Escherichia sp. ESNIH1]|uniref:DUF7940 domain-containing protein n=1 Tax=Escherichia sp. ESNIH1 TaxID=1985876 RepID=UPI000CDDF034|nr:hypothetical protein [Escherichia sp. ESNIH1]POU03614.1 hypothetical protein C3369_07285 [Escherichia sp. ESNIH1]
MIAWIAIISSIAVVLLLLQRFTSLEFVNHAKLLFKTWSVWLTSIGAMLSTSPDALLAIWAGLPDELKQMIPSTWMTYIGPGLIALGVASQFIRQDKLRREREKLERRL